MDIKKWFPSVIIGFSIAISYYLWLTALNPVGILYSVLIYLYIGILFALLVYFLLFHLTLPRLTNYSARWKIVWFIGSLLFGIWLAINIPISIPRPIITNTLIITSTGQKNPQSNGSEVWVSGLYHSDGKLVSTDEYILGDGWEIKNGVLFSPTSDIPANLTWSGQVNGNMNLVLTAHPWSGIALINWNGNQQEVDLYDPGGKDINITLPVNIPAVSIWIKLLFYFSIGTGIGLLLFGLSSWLVTRAHPSVKSINTSKKWRWLVYALPMITVWTIYLLAFWPGIMSPDSIEQWGQVVTGHYSDWHPAFHTFVIWFLTRVFNTPTSVAVVQIIVLGIIAGKILDILDQMGISKIILWIACLLFALSPINGVMIITLWKDIPYSIAILLVTYFILLIIRTNGEWILKWQNILLFGFVSGLIALFRHNGFPVAIFTPCVLLATYRKIWKPFLMTIFIVTFLFFFITGPVYKIIGVNNVPSNLMMSVPLHYLGAFISADVPLSSEEKGVLNSIMPNTHNWEYDCYFANPVIFNKNLNTPYISANKLTIIKILITLMINNPVTAVDHYRCNSSIVWRVTDSHGYVYTTPAAYGTYIQSNHYNIIPNSKIPYIETFISKISHVTSLDISFGKMVWRPAIYLYIFYFIIVIQSFRQKNLLFLLLLVPVLIQSIFVSIMALGQDFRYQYSIYLVCMIFWPIITLR